MINWNEFAKEVHAVAVEKGWWDKPVSFDDVICDCLVHLGRAYEQYRRGRPNRYHLCVASGDKRNPCEWDLGKPCPLATGELACEHRDPKPEGVAVELADCVLRLLDYLATTDADNWNIYPINIGADDLFLSFVVDSTIDLCAARIEERHGEKNGMLAMKFFIGKILGWAAQNNIDLEAILRAKHEYNKTRPCRHGGKKL